MTVQQQLRGTGVALVTPFAKDGSIDFTALGKVIDHVIKGGVGMDGVSASPYRMGYQLINRVRGLIQPYSASLFQILSCCCVHRRSNDGLNEFPFVYLQEISGHVLVYLTWYKCRW